jgi:hypothetical protein
MVRSGFASLSPPLCGSALGFWKLDMLHENPENAIDFWALIAGLIEPSKRSNLYIFVKCIVVAYHVSFLTQLESTQLDN